MVKKLTLIISIAVISAIGMIAVSLPSAHAAISAWQKGGTVMPRWNTDFSSDSFKQSLRNLAATHANYVTLVVPLYQSNIYSTDVGAGWNTPTDDSLVAGIQYAHSLGLAVMIKPHLDTYDGQWRANINPSDRTGWFTAYGNMINHYLRIAQAQQAEEFCVGTELISMANNWNPSNTSNWNSLIATARTLYSGKLTYGANWGGSGFPDEKDAIDFWPSLDYIGISAYFELNSDGSVASLQNTWDQWNKNQIQPLAARFGKPVLFTEIGYKSVSGAHYQPWNYDWGGGADQTEQTNDYTALFSYWNNVSNMQGVHLWEWSSDPNAGGGDTNYTPQNKQATQVMTQFFGTPPAPSGGGSTPPPSNAAFNLSATTNPGSPNAGQQTQITASAMETGGAVSNAIVDVEIYSGSQKLFQQYFENQTFTANQTKNYTVSWTPPAQGQYTVKAAVFGNGWSPTYTWNDSVLMITVGSTPAPPPPPPPSPSPGPSHAVNVWWPSDGSHISGTQPFKAMLTNADLSQYQMFWQVDSGGLNPMFDNMSDYPHKQVDVDVGGWNWNATGPYKITFVAKDSVGAVLGSQGVNIYR